jgi:hypothetical protein
MSVTEDTARRDWNWDTDGALDGMYVETREVSIKNGPSAGQTKLVFDFHIGLEDELVSAFETAVLRSKFRIELKARRASDFEPGERMKITPLGMKESANGKYRDFDVWYEHAAPKKSAAELLAGDEHETADVDDSPFD